MVQGVQFSGRSQNEVRRPTFRRFLCVGLSITQISQLRPFLSEIRGCRVCARLKLQISTVCSWISYVPGGSFLLRYQYQTGTESLLSNLFPTTSRSAQGPCKPYGNRHTCNHLVYTSTNSHKCSKKWRLNWPTTYHSRHLKTSSSSSQDGRSNIFRKPKLPAEAQCFASFYRCSSQE